MDMDNRSDTPEKSDAYEAALQLNQTVGTFTAHLDTETQLQQLIQAWGERLSPIQIATLRCALGAAERRGRKAERDQIMLPASSLPGGVERLDSANMNMLLRQTMSKRNLPLLVAVATSMINRGMEMTKPNPFQETEAHAGAANIGDGDRQ